MIEKFWKHILRVLTGKLFRLPFFFVHYKRIKTSLQKSQYIKPTFKYVKFYENKLSLNIILNYIQTKSMTHLTFTNKHQKMP